MNAGQPVLQDGLRSLKQDWHSQLQLRRAPAGSPGAPFPITVQLSLASPLPEDCSHFDVDDLDVHFVLQRESSTDGFPSVDGSPSTARGAERHEHCQTSTGGKHTGGEEHSVIDLSVAVTSASLPSALKQAIAHKLCIAAAAPGARASSSLPSDLASARHGEGGAGLADALAAAVRFAGGNLLDLLLLTPQLQEQYPSVSADGSSERRIKFAADAGADAFARGAAAERTAGACSEGASASDSAGAQHAKQPGSGAAHACTAVGAASPGNACALPQQLETALQRLRRRYSTLRYSAMGESVAGGLAGRAVRHAAFTVDVTPTDPDWTHEALSLTGVASLVHSGQAAAAQSLPSDVRASELPNASRDVASTGTAGAHKSAAAGRSRRAVVPVATGPAMAVELAVTDRGAIDAAVANMTTKMLQRFVASVSGASIIRTCHRSCKLRSWPSLHGSVKIWLQALHGQKGSVACAMGAKFPGRARPQERLLTSNAAMPSGSGSTCAGKPEALLAAVRYVETHGATMVHTAWDLLLEHRPAQAPAERSHVAPNSGGRAQATHAAAAPAQLSVAERACQQAASMLQGLRLPTLSKHKQSALPKPAPATSPGGGRPGPGEQSARPRDGAGAERHSAVASIAAREADRASDAQDAGGNVRARAASGDAADTDSASTASSDFTELSETTASSGV